MIPAALDHLILGCSDLAFAIEWVEKRLGIRATFGGVHPGLGTHNALVSLGTKRYLELMAPDTSQSTLGWFSSLPQLTEPRLIGWAACSTDVAALRERLIQAGIACQALREGSRRHPDGGSLRWKTFMLSDDCQGLLPFFIEWNAASVHPAKGMVPECRLERFQILTPSPEELKRTLQILGVHAQVVRGAVSELQAVIGCSAGSIKMNS